MKILVSGIENPFDKIIIPRLFKKNDQIDIFVQNDSNLNYEKWEDHIHFHQLSLSDIPSLIKHLEKNTYDLIIHNSYIKYEGNNRFLRQQMFHWNVDATEQFIIHCMENNARLLYLSTLAIYGNDPKRLPITARTEHSATSYYVSTRIRAERLIENYVLRGLNAQIVRHSYFYGKNYLGILDNIIKLKQNKMLYIKDDEVKRNVTNINSFIVYLQKIIDSEFKPGKILNIVDKEPVKIKELIQLIYGVLDQKDPPAYIYKKNFHLEFWRKCSSILNKHTLAHNISFLTRSKYLDRDYIWEEVGSKNIETINIMKLMLQNYSKAEVKK